MKSFKEILAEIDNVVEKQESSNVWISRSKKTSEKGDWSNEPASIEVLMNDKTDDYFYNAWCKLTDDTKTDLSNFIETELVPRKMRLLKKTKLLSKDNSAVRYMIARPLVTDS